jgi:uncharacterized protein YjiS (DUF1127 family)
MNCPTHRRENAADAVPAAVTRRNHRIIPVEVDCYNSRAPAGGSLDRGPSIAHHKPQALASLVAAKVSRREWQRRVRTRHELEGLSDETLRDIGSKMRSRTQLAFTER